MPANTRTEKKSNEQNLEDDFDDYKYIQRIAKENGFKSFTVEQKKISCDGGNFMGTLYVIDLKGITENGEKEINLFCKKSLPEDKCPQFGASISKVYRREDFFYREIVKKYQDIEKQWNIPEEEKIKFIKFYDESDEHVIILENMKKKGFEALDRMEIISLQTAELCIANLARFHGISYACKLQQPDFFNNIMKIDYIISNDNDFKILIDKLLESAVPFVRNEFYDKVMEFLPKSTDIMLRCCRDNTSDCSCLCHNDYKPNNIMFPVSGVTTGPIFLFDFQNSCYGCPSIDFIYFIYMSTDLKFRKQYMDHLKNLYYDTLKDYLKYYDIDVNLVMPREVFEQKFKEQRICGLILTFWAGVILYSEVGENIDLEAIDKSSKDISINEKYSERLNDTISEFIELGYI